MNPVLLQKQISLPRLVILLAAAGLLTAIVFPGDPPVDQTDNTISDSITADADEKLSALIESVVYKRPVILKPFVLSAHDGSVFGLENLQGHWSFMFFGYTHCPDVCPATMNQLVRIKKALDDLRGNQFNANVVFISVDPKRDSLPRLAEYIQYFDPSFIAVTGELEQINNIERQIGVFHRYSAANQAGEYSVQHSADIYLINPHARVTAKFQVPMDVNEVSRQYASIRAYFDKQVM